MVEVDVHPGAQDAIVARSSVSWGHLIIVPIGLSAMAAVQILVAHVLGGFPLLPLVLIGAVAVAMLSFMVCALAHARQGQHGGGSPVLLRIDPQSTTPFTLWDAVAERRVSCARISRLELRQIPRPPSGRYVVFTHTAGLVASCTTTQGALMEVVVAVQPFGRNLAAKIGELDRYVSGLQPGAGTPPPSQA